MTELPSSAKFARKTLKIILLPVVLIVGITRFTPPQWYWLDFVCLGLVLITVILVLVGRVFASKTSDDQEGAAKSK
jgi:uncharacterized membrane protein